MDTRSKDSIFGRVGQKCPALFLGSVLKDTCFFARIVFEKQVHFHYNISKRTHG